MNKRKALSPKNHPRRIPLTLFAVVWLLMDRFQPSGWVWGVVGTICAVLMILSVVDCFTAQDVELPDQLSGPDKKGGDE